MRELGELRVSDEVTLKLKRMSSAIIDRKLKHQREVLHLLRSKGGSKLGSLLKHKIPPIRLTEWNTSQVGYIEADLVVHCGSSASGQHANTLSNTEISSGWWEGEAIMSKSRELAFRALKRIEEKTSLTTPYTNIANASGFTSPGHGQTEE